jgi:hypothetical protein
LRWPVEGVLVPQPQERRNGKMIAAMVKFELKDEVREQLADVEVAKEHIGAVVDGCRKIPGLREKLFIMDPETLAQGAMLKSDEYKATVLDICEGEPRIEIYVHTANLTDGVLL